MSLLSSTRARQIQVQTFIKGKPVVVRKFHPFYVRLNVLEDPLKMSTEGVFIYAHNESHAAPLACTLWDKWRRSAVVETDYPKLAEGVKHPVAVTAIDDDDYKEFLKDALKMDHYSEGDEQDPPAFMVKGREIFGVEESRQNKNV